MNNLQDLRSADLPRAVCANNLHEKRQVHVFSTRTAGSNQNIAWVTSQ